jgi:uncharacterized damage-inducible protein DinB
MKTHFLKLLDYDRFANLEILKLINEANEPELAVKLMAHLLSAQQVWYKRCKGLPDAGRVLWPDWKADTFEKTINENHDAWVSYVSELNPEDFNKVIAYQTLRGDSYENLLSDILAHLINHGTHHRAQAGQQLKQAGIENLPLTDYIFYIR